MHEWSRWINCQYTVSFCSLHLPPTVQSLHRVYYWYVAHLNRKVKVVSWASIAYISLVCLAGFRAISYTAYQFSLVKKPIRPAKTNRTVPEQISSMPPFHSRFKTFITLPHLLLHVPRFWCVWFNAVCFFQLSKWSNCDSQLPVGSQTEMKTNRSGNVQMNELYKKCGKAEGTSGNADNRKVIRSPDATQQTL